MKKNRFLIAVLLLSICLLFVCAASASGEGKVSYGFIDRQGKVVVEPKYDYAYSFENGMGRFFMGDLKYNFPDTGRYGFVDATGKEVIPAIYDGAGDFNEYGLAPASLNGKYGIIDREGKTVLDFTYDHLSYKKDNQAYVAYLGSLDKYGFPGKGTYIILDGNFKKVFEIECDSLSANGGYFAAEKDGKKAVISPDGKQITGYDYAYLGTSSESIAYYKKGDGELYGLINVDDGSEITEPRYDSVGRFRNGKAIAKIDTKYYLIDTAGAVLLEYKGDYVDIYYSGDCTSAFEGTVGKYGYGEVGYYYLMKVDDGTYVSRAYEKGDCYSVDSYGRWRVQEKGLWYVLDMNGKEITPPFDADKLMNCGEDRFVVEKGGMYALADLKGNMLTDFIWKNMSTSGGELIAVKYEETEPDFRYARWGMTEVEVKEKEGGFPDYTGKVNGANANYIGYNTTLMGNDVIVAFYFGPRGLYEARYIWAEKHTNESLFISDYESLRAQMKKKYGIPAFDDEEWDTPSHQKYYADNKGDALSFGYLTYETGWRTDRSRIVMKMSADNYVVSFIIYYNSEEIPVPEEDYSDLI